MQMMMILIVVGFIDDNGIVMTQNDDNICQGHDHYYH